MTFQLSSMHTIEGEFEAAPINAEFGATTMSRILILDGFSSTSFGSYISNEVWKNCLSLSLVGSRLSFFSWLTLMYISLELLIREATKYASIGDPCVSTP